MIEWIILECFNCDPKEARAKGWSYEAVQRTDSVRDWAIPYENRGREAPYKTQGACLRALFKAQPAQKLKTETVRGDWFETSHAVIHHRDYVEAFAFTNFTQTYNYGCFHRNAKALPLS